MEPSKKDFSPEELKKLLREIEKAPKPDEIALKSNLEPSLAHSLGEELEEVPVFGEHAHAPVQACPETPPSQEPLPMESWLKEIANQKVDEILKKQDLEQSINQILREILPTLSETIITKEITKIKEQIKGL